MKVLILGSGGREHAIAWKLSQSSARPEIHTAPGNPGTLTHGRNLPLPDLTPSSFLAAAESVQADLTVVGPEAPLVAGVVDIFQSHGRAIIGPSAAAARLEGSKVFCKSFLDRHHIPTARSHKYSSRQEAAPHLSSLGFPVVLKTDGLAAGKGVIIAASLTEATAALDSLPDAPLLIEEFLTGEEVSFIVYVRNGQAIPLEATQDHKTIFDGDTGPNTGGMGAYCDGRILTARQTSEIMDTIIEPTVSGMNAGGAPYSGFLYAGLMMTAAGPKVLEYNARLGDPETQALLHRMDSDLLATLLDGSTPTWKSAPSVCVVLASHGYPGPIRTGDAITGLDRAQCQVFHAGTALRNGALVTSGGRVLGVTHSGPSLHQAIHNAYHEVAHITFDGLQKRTDIGAKGLKRW
ncbi:MAG: phosphoribosylamine--glycine ligase [Bryobacterales bacterium]|nr:phosphoribosylamine--glycine ligase [Bryobacterales bacterium]